MDNASSLTEVIDDLAAESIIAVDTESDSLYSYYEKVCLVQISTSAKNYLIDPLAIDITPLGVIFAASCIQKIFHAVEYDVMSLRRDYGFHFNNLFDTMLAARILGWPRFGLGDILETHFNVVPDKRFQHYNWGQRPLDQDALDYAYLDTYHLLALRHIQAKELQTHHRDQEAAEAFERVTQVRTATKVFDPAAFWHIKGAKQLYPDRQAALQALFVFRDRAARQADRPPFKIMHDSALVQIALRHPKTLKELKIIKGVGSSFLKRYGHKVLALLKKPLPESIAYVKQPRIRPSESVLHRYEHLRSWRNAAAKTRGVEPDVILSNEVLLLIAKANPPTHAELSAKNILGPWKFQTYASTIIERLRATQ